MQYLKQSNKLKMGNETQQMFGVARYGLCMTYFAPADHRLEFRAT